MVTNHEFQPGQFQACTFAFPPARPDRPKWWILVTFSCLLVTGLYAALRSGFMVGERASQLGSILNSTEFRLAETARREVAFFESTGTANCETDFATGTLIRVNDALCSLLGYQRDELTGKTFGDITHPDDVPMSNAALLDESGQPRKNLQFEKRYCGRTARSSGPCQLKALLRCQWPSEILYDGHHQHQ